ncbi:nitroreductase family deazaflavin-dependent oxidoreductase [Williamsia maris]|uniref:Deazaflavin-dependent oxidoreductase, nitroreductase family n=1 Tax=Williamsia maris TaxID=72806 RepID=A0ABT1HFC3_9NOCA|nr:nitroreductase family deazaflavin-dependent oxidoreductase [Williamsia maris]MCP2176946.1 deazaflavin-dependent oxidoreductase, nitroreductase family [Williamsia maris]
MTTTHYAEPTGRIQFAFNDMVSWLSDHGIGLAGARTLTVVGRKSGEPKTTPVNPLVIDGRTYLISPRGNTQWSRNLRAAGVCDIGRGRRVDTYTAVEVADEKKIALLRPYLKRWGWEVASYLPAKVTHTSSNDELAAIAPAVPVFELHRN